MERFTAPYRQVRTAHHQALAKARANLARARAAARQWAEEKRSLRRDVKGGVRRFRRRFLAPARWWRRSAPDDRRRLAMKVKRNRRRLRRIRSLPRSAAGYRLRSRILVLRLFLLLRRHWLVIVLLFVLLLVWHLSR